MKSAAFSRVTPPEDQPELGQGAKDILEVAWTSESRRVDFDVVGSGFPSREHLGRRECPDDCRYRVAAAHLDGCRFQGGGDDVLSTGEYGDSRSFRIENGSRPR